MTWGDHVDIQVGSHIYLSVCLLWSIAYALRWRVTHLGLFHHWAIAHPVDRTFFQVQGRSRRRFILEVDFKECRVVAWMIFGIICIGIVNFNMYLY